MVFTYTSTASAICSIEMHSLAWWASSMLSGPRMIVGIFATLTRYVMSQVAVKPAARTDLPRTAVAASSAAATIGDAASVIEGKITDPRKYFV